MSLLAQKLRSSRGNCNDVWSIYSTHAQLLCCIFFMAACLLVGPKSRVNFSAGSKRALEPREHMLSTLKELLQIEREKRHIQGVCNPPTESVKIR